MLADNHCRITGPIVEDALQKLGNAPAGAVLVQVFDCFHVPKVRFDHVRQRFYPLTETLTIHATAQVRQTLVYTLHDLNALIMYRNVMQDRFNMYLDRLLLLHQRLRRDKTFSRPALADADISEQNTYCQVMPHYA